MTTKVPFKIIDHTKKPARRKSGEPAITHCNYIS